MDNTDRKCKSACQNILAAICLVLVLVGCQTDTPPATVEANALSARELYSQALEIAKEWKLDAYLIDVHVIGGEGNKQGDFVSYRFYSPSTPYIALDLDYDADSGSFTDKLFPASKLDFKDTLEIRDNDWKVDSPEALAIAQAHGGGEFLAKWDASPSLTLQKEESAGGVATLWRVSYFDVRSFETLRVRICAGSGQVLAVSTDSMQPAISMTLLFAVLDGLDPGNFVTLVFYVSFLTLANRYGRNLLLIGAAFALSLFSTYVLLRSVLLETVLSIDAYSLLTPWVYLITALLCLVLAISIFLESFSKRDFHQSRTALHRTRSRLVFVVAAIIAGFVFATTEFTSTSGPGWMLMMPVPPSPGLMLWYLTFSMPLLLILSLALFWRRLRRSLPPSIENRVSAFRWISGAIFAGFAAWMIWLAI